MALPSVVNNQYGWWRVCSGLSGALLKDVWGSLFSLAPKFGAVDSKLDANRYLLRRPKARPKDDDLVPEDTIAATPRFSLLRLCRRDDVEATSRKKCRPSAVCSRDTA